MMTQCGRLRDTRRLRTERRPASTEMINSGRHRSVDKVVTKLMTFQISDLVSENIPAGRHFRFKYSFNILIISTYYFRILLKTFSKHFLDLVTTARQDKLFLFRNNFEFGGKALLSRQKYT